MESKKNFFHYKNTLLGFGVIGLLMISGCSSKEKVLPSNHKTISQVEIDFNRKLQEKTIVDPVASILPSKRVQTQRFERDVAKIFSSIDSYQENITKREAFEEKKKLEAAILKRNRIQRAKEENKRKAIVREEKKKKQVISTFYN